MHITPRKPAPHSFPTKPPIEPPQHLIIQSKFTLTRTSFRLTTNTCSFRQAVVNVFQSPMPALHDLCRFAVASYPQEHPAKSWQAVLLSHRCRKKCFIKGASLDQIFGFNLSHAPHFHEVVWEKQILFVSLSLQHPHPGKLPPSPQTLTAQALREIPTITGQRTPLIAMNRRPTEIVLTMSPSHQGDIAGKNQTKRISLQHPNTLQSDETTIVCSPSFLLDIPRTSRLDHAHRVLSHIKFSLLGHTKRFAYRPG